MAHYVYVDGDLYWHNPPTQRVKAGRPVGHTTKFGYRVFTLDNQKYSVHRVVWGMHNGPVPMGVEIDHINGQRADNRIDNLRLATRSQNGMNHKIHSHNSLGIKNIFTRTRGNCLQYIGVVVAQGKQHRKSSTDLAVIRRWVMNKREELHGEYANHG